MTSPPKSTAPDQAQKIHNAFQALDTYLNAVIETMRMGHMPDMAQLDKRVADLCQMVEQSEREVQQQCLPKLVALQVKIDGCDADMRALHTSQSKGTA